MFSVKNPLPVITARVNFKFNKFPPPPPITLRQSHEKTIRLIRRSRPYMPPRGLPSHRHHHHRQTTPFNNVDEESDSTDESNLPDSPESENKATLPLAKIPKPPGEAGRKNSGGFNLQEVLGWNDNKYKEFMQWIADETTSKLNLSKPFSKQKPEAIQDLIQQGTKKFKIVDRYEMNWPIREALKGRLKNTSNRAKRKVQHQTDRKIKEAVMSSARARKNTGDSDDSEESSGREQCECR